MTAGESEAVRVAVRIRPLRPVDRSDGAQEILRKVAGEPQVVLGVDRSFTFDHVLDAASAQNEVYDECVQTLVARVLKGYNSTVLAYGQTGSGKTHTMGSGGGASGGEEGSTPPASACADVGIIPRTVRELFSRVGKGGSDLEGAALSAKVSFIEVYKEEIHDLLQRPSEAAAGGGAESAPSASANAPAKLATLDIRETKDGSVSLPGMHARAVTTPEEVMGVLAEGSSNRATGSTAMNASSSRSHAIFTVCLELRLRNGKLLTPRFNFVDLAGSERAKRTGASGDRFAEGVQINKGLLALGNVITALCERQAHVPYRDSKLTRLLQDSLGGNAHTLMIACVSPSDADMEETLNTLKYANRARQITNKLLIAQDPVQARIAELTEQVATLTARLKHYESGGAPLPPLPSAAPAGPHSDTPAAAAASGAPPAGAASRMTDLALQRCQQLQIKLQAVRAANAAKAAAGIASADGTGPAGARPGAVDGPRAGAVSGEAVGGEGAGAAAGGEAASAAGEAAAAAGDVTTGEVSGGDAADGDGSADAGRPEEVALKQEQLEEELEFLTKQGEMSEALATLDESLALKMALLQQQEMSGAESGCGSVSGEVEEMQRVLADLEASVKATGRERDELAVQIAELQEASDAKAAALRESFSRKLEAAEAQLRALRAQQSTQVALLGARVAAERRVRELADEIGTIKAQKVALSRRMREDADAHRSQHAARERELKATRRKEERTAAQLDRLQQDHAKQAAVLKRKHEEIAALQRRGVGGGQRGVGARAAGAARAGGLTRPDASLPHVMNKVTAAQQARLADSRHAQSECATVLGARPKEWFGNEVEAAVAMHQAREEKEVLIEKRRQATSLLAAKEEAAAAPGASPTAAREADELRARVAAHSREISVLNQRLSQREDGAQTKIETISSVNMSKALLRCAFEQAVAAQLVVAAKGAQLQAKDRAIRDATDLTNSVRLQLYSERAKAQAREKRDAAELAALQLALAALTTAQAPPAAPAAAGGESDFARLERRLQQKAAAPQLTAHVTETDGEEATDEETETEPESEEEVVGSDVDWSDTEEARAQLRRAGRRRQAMPARAAAVTSGMFAGVGEGEPSVAARRGRRVSNAPWAEAEARPRTASPRDPRVREVEPLLDRLSRKGTKPPPPPPPPASPVKQAWGSGRAGAHDKGMHERHGVDELRANLANVRRKLGQIDSNQAPEHRRSSTGVKEPAGKESILEPEHRLSSTEGNGGGEGVLVDPAAAGKEAAVPDREGVVIEPAPCAGRPAQAKAGAEPRRKLDIEAADRGETPVPQPRRKLNNPKMLKHGAGLQPSAWTVQVDL